MKCWICDKDGGKRRYSKDGIRLFIEPTCDTCTIDMIKTGWDIVLEPQNINYHASQNPRWPNYPVLKSIINDK